YVESLTKQLEEEALAYIQKIDEMGGMLDAIEKRFPQKEIANASFAYQQEIERKEKIIVGVNDYTIDNEEQIELLRISLDSEKEQIQNLLTLRKQRDQEVCGRALKTLQEKASGKENLIPHILNCVRSYATEGEIVAHLKKVF